MGTSASDNTEKGPPHRDSLGRVSGGNPGNSGGKKGRSGRKTAAWKIRCTQALERCGAEAVTEQIVTGKIKGSKPQDRLAAIKFLASYAHGQPTQDVKHDGEIVVKVQFDGD